MDWSSIDTAPVVQLVTKWGIQVLGAIVFLLIGRAIAGWMRRAARKAMERASMDTTLVPFVASMVYYGALGFVVIGVLNLFGVPTASLVAVFGAAGLAIGLALQGTLSHFAAGVMLLVFRPFRVGDFVEVGGQSGTVKEVRIFSTELDTADNVRVIVPNGSVWGNVLKNYATNDLRRIDLVMGVDYGDDLGAALATIARVVEADARVLKEPAPVYAVHELADSSVNIVVRPWCTRTDYWALRWELTRGLKEQLEAAGCSIPFPQRDVHLHGKLEAS